MDQSEASIHLAMLKPRAQEGQSLTRSSSTQATTAFSCSLRLPASLGRLVSSLSSLTISLFVSVAYLRIDLSVTFTLFHHHTITCLLESCESFLAPPCDFCLTSDLAG